MKKLFTLALVLCLALAGFAQVDSTKKNEPDTIKVGGMIIIRNHGDKNESNEDKDNNVNIGRRKYNKTSNVSTNWWILDLGFSNYNDNSNYAAAQTSGFTSGGVTEESMKLKTWQSRNVNLWFFMQKLNVVKHVVNLKYGLGLELNNYFFKDERIHLQKKSNPDRS